jgi:hypothetical protein
MPYKNANKYYYTIANLAAICPSTFRLYTPWPKPSKPIVWWVSKPVLTTCPIAFWIAQVLPSPTPVT